MSQVMKLLHSSFHHNLLQPSMKLKTVFSLYILKINFAKCNHKLIYLFYESGSRNELQITFTVWIPPILEVSFYLFDYKHQIAPGINKSLHLPYFQDYLFHSIEYHAILLFAADGLKFLPLYQPYHK